MATPQDDVINEPDAIISTQASSSTKRKTSIQDLPNKILDYIFSFLNFMQRSQIDSVCQHWREVNCWPTEIRLPCGSAPQCRKLDDVVLNSVLSRRGHSCNKLDLKCNSKLTCESVSKIGRHCPKLAKMDLECANREQSTCLKTLAPSCPNLKTLRFKNYCDGPKLCDDGLTAVAMHCLKNRCHSVKEIQMDYCDVSDQPAFFNFIKHFKDTLKVLRLRSLFFIPNAKWHEEVQELPNLEVLELYRCGHVDDALLEVLASKCVKIRSLDVCSSEITDVGVLALQKLPDLKQLSVGSSVSRGLEGLVGKGILRQVTAPRRLEQLCRNLAIRYPRVRFILDPTKDEAVPEGDS